MRKVSGTLSVTLPLRSASSWEIISPQYSLINSFCKETLEQGVLNAI